MTKLLTSGVTLLFFSPNGCAGSSLGAGGCGHVGTQGTPTMCGAGSAPGALV